VLFLVDLVLEIYKWVIIAAALITWLSLSPRNPLVMMLRQATEPVLAPARRLLPPWKTGGLDFSPLIVIFAIHLVQWALPRLLFQAQY
jgi:YggT family protein